MKALVGTFNQEKALVVGAFSVIVNTDCETGGSSTALVCIPAQVTSTTLHFRFVPPTNIGGLPLDAYAVEYKETRHEWNLARRRVWPLGGMLHDHG